MQGAGGCWATNAMPIVERLAARSTMPRSPSAVAPGSERYPAELLCAIVSGARDHLREHPRDSGFALAPLDTGGHVDEPEFTTQDDVGVTRLAVRSLMTRLVSVTCRRCDACSSCRNGMDG